MPKDEATILNIRAMQALSGSSTEWRKDLAALLRSDAPVEPWVRKRLAEAVENETLAGARLDLRNHDGRRRRAEKVSARFEWMRIGRWMNARRSEGCTVEECVWRASEHFETSEGTCKNAWEYFRPANQWISQGLSTEAGSVLGEILLESMYHQIFADPKDKSFVRMNQALLLELGLPH